MRVLTEQNTYFKKTILYGSILEYPKYNLVWCYKRKRIETFFKTIVTMRLATLSLCHTNHNV